MMHISLYASTHVYLPLGTVPTQMRVNAPFAPTNKISIYLYHFVHTHVDCAIHKFASKYNTWVLILTKYQMLGRQFMCIPKIFRMEVIQDLATFRHMDSYVIQRRNHLVLFE